MSDTSDIPHTIVSSKCIGQSLHRHRFADIISDDQRIAQLDPLEADNYLTGVLPYLNDQGDLEAIARFAARYIPRTAIVAGLDRWNAQAATRDLGMIAASLRRWEAPLSTVPGLEESLLALSMITGEVPADTVYSYGPRNPVGPRMRRFTQQPGEKEFISSFRRGMANLPVALDLLMEAQRTGIFDYNYITLLRTADDFYREMIEAIVAVRRKVTPEFFTNVLRPYFDPKEIGEETYLGPGGAQMPQIIVDQLLWGMNCHDESYHEYFADNLKYQPTVIRQLSSEINKLPSLVRSAQTQAAQAPELTPLAGRSLRALSRLLGSIAKFRAPHLAVAKANFALRSDYALGSGGYQPDILEYLGDRVQDARNTIKTILLEAGQRATD